MITKKHQILINFSRIQSILSNKINTMNSKFFDPLINYWHETIIQHIPAKPLFIRPNQLDLK